MSISLLLKLILELINPSSSGLTTLFELLFLGLIIGLTTSLTLFIGSIPLKMTAVKSIHYFRFSSYSFI